MVVMRIRSVVSLPLAALLLVHLVAGQLSATAAEPHPFLVAAAADLQFAFTDLGKAFEKTGQKVTFSFGATGTLARQIENGAPFDAFFAANEQFVADLDQKLLLVPGTRQVYAVGHIVLASNKKAGIDVRDLKGLLDARIKRVAIANPEHAPYGLAARAALQKAGVWEQLQPKLVLGENIRQTLQFIQTGNAEAGIVALSVAGVPEIRTHRIDSRLHAPLLQAAAVVRGTPNEAIARRFLAYVVSKEGQAVMKQFGFDPPPRR
jgi:molybdate transport system substrate-binding protein